MGSASSTWRADDAAEGHHHPQVGADLEHVVDPIGHRQAEVECGLP